MTLPAFAEYTPDRYRAEIGEAMRSQRTSLDTLRDDPTPATIENVLVAWEAARAPLNLVLSTFYTVRSSDATDEIDAIADDIAPSLAAHHDAIQLDRGLYDRLKSLRARIDAGEVQADAQDNYHLDELLKDFERAGVALNGADQTRLRELNTRLAELGSQFQRLNREARNAAKLSVTEDELAGLSPSEIEALHAEDGYELELVNTTQQPLAAKIQDAGLRRRLLDASLSRALGEVDTREVLVETARVRAERASLLGFESHAELVAAEGTAKTTQAIESVLIPLAQAALAKARSEAEDLKAKYAQLNPGAEFTAADWTFVESALRKERFAFDESQLDEYLTVERVVQAAYDAATDLYGITFETREDLVGHTSDARVYEIRDEDGSPVGLFLMDLWARPTKNGGAWMTQIVEQSDLTEDLPIVTNNCNYRRAVPTVSWDEVITMFHEFGHALHGLFGRAKYASRSGTAVPRDFVEFPSQVNEHWAWQPDRVLPAEWLDKLKAASEFGLGYAKAEALIAAVLDFVWHTTPLENLPTSADQVADFEAAALDRFGLRDDLVPPRYRSQYFAHIWGGGYAASYYGYTWAEVLDADAVAWFEENGGGTRANGDHFRRTLLGPGGGVDPMETYRQFRGRDPQLQPLLDRLGLTLAESGQRRRTSVVETLGRYLRSEREALLWKAEGLSEYDLRLPRTPTGTNLLGLVRHCAMVEHGYLVDSMGRRSSVALPKVDFDADPNGDFVTPAEESAASVLQLYRDVAAEVDRSIAELDADSPGHVEWWGERGDTTFQRLLVHVLAEVARHAGHADILREGIDGASGLSDGNTNIWAPEGGWEAHVARVTAIAEASRADG